MTRVANKKKISKKVLSTVKSIKSEVKSDNLKIGNYSIKEFTSEFNKSRLESESGKRHFILSAILKNTSDNLKSEKVFSIKETLKGKETLAGQEVIAYSLIGKYNRFLIANNLKIRVKAKGVPFEGKKVLMARNLTVYIPIG